MDYEIRPVTAGEWHSLKELRLAALSDPAASIAFRATLAEASAYPDEQWQEDARASELGRGSVTYVGETSDGTWAAMATILLASPERPKAQVVGFYVRPEHRGAGLAGALLRAATERATRGSITEQAGTGSVFLWVHEDNVPAVRLYEAQGFIPTGDVEVDWTGTVREYVWKGSA